ncbi:MAG TPA: SdrD B-like domain-containing protein, partial [Kiritimatiellia bacterium]|nr:SdrD B-like domain-containing protein [Kiritimatiellia bacterium]
MGQMVMRLLGVCLWVALGAVAWADGVLDGRIGEPYGSTRAIDAAGNDTEGDGECHATGGRGDVMDFHALSMPGSSATNAAWWFAWTVDSSRDLNATSGDFFGNPSTMTVNYLIGIEVNCDGAPRLEMWQNGQAWEREFAWNVDYFIAMYPDGVNSMRAQLWRNDGSNLRTQIGGEFSVTSRVSGFRRQVELTLPADLAGLPEELRNNSTLCMYLVSVENSEPTGRVIDGVGLNSLVLVNGVNCSTTGFDLTAAGIQFINSQPLGKAGGRPTDPGVNDRQTLSNGRRDTTASVTCPNCPETGFAINGQVKPQYQLLTEAGFAAPYVGGSTSASDFIGESSARSITFGTTGSTNTTVLVGSFNHGDVANVYAYGDARYLYVLVSGPGALGWDNEPDRMNVYLALDVVGRNSNNDSATTNTLNDRLSNSGALGPTAPNGRLVNFKGWDPDYVVELVWRGVNQGVDAPANLYAANGTIGNWSLATTFLYQDVADTLSALVRPYYSRTFQQYEFAIPWTNLGFATVPAPTNRFRLAAYTTADENTGGVSAWDVADSAPGIGQGPTGLGAHERVGDDALDTDFLDAVDGLGDFAPFVGRSFGAPGFEPATDNTGFDVDTLEEYFVWSLDITTCAQLGDFVWHDANLDGVQSGGETGVAGVVIRLLSNGVAIASTTSSVSGAYAFTNLVPFTNYVVEFVRPSGMYFTALQAGGNTNLDSNADPVNGRSSVINLGSGETNRTVDAGLVFGASLGDFVWHDVNRDGVQNGGETGFPATVVRLLSNGVTVASTTTTVSGAYAFTNLPPFTNYAIEVAAPVGAVATLVFQGGNTNLDSNIDAVTLRSDSVTLGSGQSNNTIDAGFFYPARLGDFIWHDTNLNGIQDGSETGMPGVVVRLLSNGVAIATTTSSVSGAYAFTNLAPFTNYVIEVVPPVNAFVSTPFQGGNTNVDSNIDAVTLRSDVVILLSGQNNPSIDAGLFFNLPGIDIEKATNGQDADTPTGPILSVGAPVTWTYVVRNTGNVGVTNVVVYDSDIGFITNLISGDLNGNRVIETNETWTYTASGFAVSGQYDNLGAVTGRSVVATNTVSDTDPSHYFGASGAIDIEKATNGQDADTPTGPTVAVGSNVTWTYVVRNTGNIGITNVVVYDSDIGFITNLVSGDLNGNRVIETNETWTYTASGIAVAGQYANLGSVTGVTVSTGSQVTDTDPSHYFGSQPGIVIEKATNGQDADNAPGPTLGIGSAVTWTYAVTNTGNVALTNVVVTDDRVGAITNRLSGDVNS